MASVDTNSIVIEKPESPMLRQTSRAYVVAEQSSRVFLAQVVALICGLANNFLIAWMLGPEGKACIYLVQFASSTSVVFLNLGLGPAAVFQLGRSRQLTKAQVASGIFWCSLAGGIVPLIAVVAARQWVLNMVGAKMDPTLLWITVIAIPGMTLMWNTGYLSMALGEISKFNITRAAYAGAFSICLFFALFAGHVSVHSVAWLFLVSITVPGIYSIHLIVEAGGPWMLPGYKTLIKTLRFGWHSHLGAVTQFMQHRIDVILLSYFLALREVGLFSLAVAIAELLWYVPQTVATVLMPHVAESSHEDANRLTSAFCRICIFFTLLLSLGLGLTSTWMIGRFLPAFRSAIPVLWILLPGMVVATVFKVLSSDLNGRGRPLETIRPAATALIVCFLGGILLIPRYGMLGAASLTTLGYVINTGLYLKAYSRVSSLPAQRLLVVNRQDFSTLSHFCRSILTNLSQ